MRRLLAVVSVLLVHLALTTSGAGATSTGTGRVFAPNPVASLQRQDLTDQKDADYAALQAAYKSVKLTNLDGSGSLVGDWAKVVSETGNPAFSKELVFNYGRSDDRFEQVMAYYWATEAQKYIQSLGFGSGKYRAVNKESQDLRINQYGVDNSFSWDKKDLLRFGKGGVDDAEDAEVILHEYGHAIHDSQVSGFGPNGGEAGAIGEGFGDYWAVTVSNVLFPTPDPACVADWDAVSYTSQTPHCLRRVDGNKHYPEDLEGEVHDDGEIWSRALWDIRKALGNVTADTVILESQFSFAPDTSMPAAAQTTVNTAGRLYGKSASAKVLKVFQARGILK